MQPIRGDIHVAVDYPKPVEEMTLRDAVDWFKLVKTTMDNLEATLGRITVMEHKYVGQRWGHLVDQIAKREEIPVGSIAWILSEVANSEMRLGK